MDAGEKKLRKLIRESIKRNHKKIISECIIAAGQLHGHEDFALVKSRDRNYHANVKVYREMSSEEDSLEIIYMLDDDTGYTEGMNSSGIGIVNSALLVGDDEKAVKGKKKSHDGDVMKKALQFSSLNDVIKTLTSYKNGIKGHTFVGSPDAMYSIEMTSKHNPIIKKLNPTTGFDVRTNHGEDHSSAGYSPERKPDDYLGSKIRKATAEVELNGIDDWGDLAPSLAKQPFETGSNYNVLRRSDNMRTTSQVAMNLDQGEFALYIFPNECTYHGMVDNTPNDYQPKIKFKLVNWNE